jgi:hypothetical protein
VYTEFTLYRTRGGALFTVSEWRLLGRLAVHCVPTNQTELSEIVRHENIEIITPGIIDEPPEAVEEASPGSTVYVRWPTALKEKVSRAASAKQLSMSAWTAQCIESHLALSSTARAGTFEAPLPGVGGR